MEPIAPGYPATFEVDHPERITNWKPLVQWLLAFPHYLVLRGLEYLSGAVAVISWFAIVFTGRLPEGLASAQHLYIRYVNRTRGLRRVPAGGVPAVRVRHHRRRRGRVSRRAHRVPSRSTRTATGSRWASASSS